MNQCFLATMDHSNRREMWPHPPMLQRLTPLFVLASLASVSKCRFRCCTCISCQGIRRRSSNLQSRGNCARCILLDQPQILDVESPLLFSGLETDLQNGNIMHLVLSRKKQRKSRELPSFLEIFCPTLPWLRRGFVESDRPFR